MPGRSCKLQHDLKTMTPASNFACQQRENYVAHHFQPGCSFEQCSFANALSRLQDNFSRCSASSARLEHYSKTMTTASKLPWPRKEIYVASQFFHKTSIHPCYSFAWQAITSTAMHYITRSWFEHAQNQNLVRTSMITVITELVMFAPRGEPVATASTAMHYLTRSWFEHAR